MWTTAGNNSVGGGADHNAEDGDEGTVGTVGNNVASDAGNDAGDAVGSGGGADHDAEDKNTEDKRR